ncbi:hypothetical protein WN48_04838 [Eufriesea mexicana]|uniref:Uncharacterized protein n=1 Tax=Eufriesea mexicana TaxID=516756 RepID=A0A310SDB9_9HYME|nr:hypothetical protein WN48_04838 [Eufriesea mexicana]
MGGSWCRIPTGASAKPGHGFEANSDAAERLLTLLGVDEENEDLVSSSEDEGVELDVDELEDEEEEQENTRLLHQLAASLAKELKQSQQRQSSSRTMTRDPFDMDRMELIGTSYLEHSCLQQQNPKGTSCYRDSGSDKCQRQEASRSFGKQRTISESYQCLDGRLRMDQEPEDGGSSVEQVPASWNAGWDACATEALRYLVEDEGLPPHHPTVLAMKDHLELQRERTFARYTT